MFHAHEFFSSYTKLLTNRLYPPTANASTTKHFAQDPVIAAVHHYLSEESFSIP
jgi:hypothetical protein